MRERSTRKSRGLATLRISRRRRVIAIVLLLCLIGAGAILGQRLAGFSQTSRKPVPNKEAAITSASFDSPSKEYIYAGGKLLATEEPQTPTCTVTFNDVTPANPYYADICDIATRGITIGCATGVYCPDSPVTRAQMAIFIERSLGIFNPPTPTSQRFTDVPPTHTAYAFIDDLANRGITLGCAAGFFCPDEGVTHEQMSAFMERAVGRFQPPTPPSQTFCDVPPSNSFYEFIADYFTRGVWPGCDGVGTGGSCQSIPGCTTASQCFCPSRVVTRSEMARILVRNFNGFPPVPSAPTGVTATPGSAKVTLSWNAPPTGATSYKVRRSTTSGNGYVDVATVSGTTTSHMDMPVTSGVTYFYVIAATNSNGSIGLNSSPQVSATPQ